MSTIEFNAEEKEAISQRIKRYFETELDQEIGSFEAQFLLEFISEEIGAYYYNRGLQDALVLFQERMDSAADAIYEIEKPLKQGR